KRLLGDLGDADRPIGTGDREPAIREGDVGYRRLHHVGGDLAPLVDQPVGGDDDRGARELGRARAKGADPHRHQIAVAIAVADQIGVDAELFRQDLLKGRAVALAVIHAAGHQYDSTRWVETDLGMLVIAAAACGDGGRDPDAEQLAPAPRGVASLGGALVVSERQTIRQVLWKVAAIVSLAEGGGEWHGPGGDRVAAAQL